MIPLASIIHVEVNVEHLGMWKTVRIHCDAADDSTEKVIEFRVGWLHRWVAAFRRLDIPVSGGEAVKFTTIKGFLNDYGWFLWFPFLGVVWIFSWAIWHAFHLNRDNFDFLMISFGILGLIQMVVSIGILWKFPLMFR